MQRSTTRSNTDPDDPSLPLHIECVKGTLEELLLHCTGGGSSAERSLFLSLAMDTIQRRLLSEAGVESRAVCHLGWLIGAMIGTTSIAFDFYGAAVGEAKAILDAEIVPWQRVFVTERVRTMLACFESISAVCSSCRSPFLSGKQTKSGK